MKIKISGKILLKIFGGNISSVSNGKDLSCWYQIASDTFLLLVKNCLLMSEGEV